MMPFFFDCSKGVLKSLLFNEDFTAIRRKVVFKIIPMLNADGVTVGNSRSGFSGSF